MDIVDRLDNALSEPSGGTWIGNATVSNAATGTFPDGRRKITVIWRGASIDCGYNAAYTPAVGDHVTFLKSGSSFWVLGKSA